jgi:hypothetical protein
MAFESFISSDRGHRREAVGLVNTCRLLGTNPADFLEVGLGEVWRCKSRSRPDLLEARFLSADDTAGDTDSGSSASPAQEQTRLEQRTSAKLPEVSQTSKRPAR